MEINKLKDLEKFQNYATELDLSAQEIIEYFSVINDTLYFLKDENLYHLASIVGKYFKLTVSQMFIYRRKTGLVIPRHVFFYYATKKYTTEYIKKFIGFSNQSSVTYGKIKIMEYLSIEGRVVVSDINIKRSIEELDKLI